MFYSVDKFEDLSRLSWETTPNKSGYLKKYDKINVYFFLTPKPSAGNFSPSYCYAISGKHGFLQSRGCCRQEERDGEGILALNCLTWKVTSITLFQAIGQKYHITLTCLQRMLGNWRECMGLLVGANCLPLHHLHSFHWLLCLPIIEQAEVEIKVI